METPDRNSFHRRGCFEIRHSVAAGLHSVAAGSRQQVSNCGDHFDVLLLVTYDTTVEA